MNAKEAFQKQFGKEHSDAVAASWFQEAVRTAMLISAEKWSQESDATSGHFKTQGAFEFIREFRKLSIPDSLPTPKDFDNLK